MSEWLHRNSWFHDWLVENKITSESAAITAATDSRRLADLIRRAEEDQQSEPLPPMGRRSLLAGRSLDLTRFLVCGHPDCLTRQVDDLFSRVWHYFDKIAIVGPDAHAFLELVMEGRSAEYLATSIGGMSRPIFHIRDIGADDLVTWVAKPPACAVHWHEFKDMHEYHLPDEVEKSITLALLREGNVRLDKSGKGPRLVLAHKEVFAGKTGEYLSQVTKARQSGESLQMTLVRGIVDSHWLAAASDMYAAQYMDLPLGLGIGLEARLASLRRESISTADIAFRLQLPVVDGLPVKELLALRASEQDAFEGFRDSITQAIKERVAASDAAEDVDTVAREIQEDVVEPSLHEIQRRLRAAEGVLRKNHRYNIAVAGLATVCGLAGAMPLAIPLAVGAIAGATAVEAKLVNEKKEISLSGMYFLWQAKEYAQRANQAAARGSRRRRR